MNHKLLLLCVFFVNFFTIKAQTTILKSGIIDSDEVLSADTVKITGNISVQDGVTLTVNPGTLLEFQGHFSINVEGTLLACGTFNEKIVFTAGDSLLTSSSGGWQGIRFINTPATNDSSFFDYCEFYFGNAFGSNWIDQQGGILAIKDFNKIRIRNCKFIKSQAVGSNGIIYIRNSNPQIIDNLIASNSGTGIEISDNGNPLIVNNIIVQNSGFGINRNSYTPVIKNCIIAYNQSGNIKELTNPGNYILFSDILNAGFNTNGNLDIDPEFENIENGIYTLKPTSPCIDMGSPNFGGINLRYDLAGNNRIYRGLTDSIVDMGAYELSEEPALLFGAKLDTLEFDSLLTGLSQTKEIFAVNYNSYPVTISSITSGDSDILAPEVNNRVINPLDSLAFEIVFKPKTDKTYNSWIVIESNYRKAPKDTIIVLGKGLPAPGFYIQNKKIEASLDCTDSTVVNLIIENNGKSSLEYKIPTDFTENFEEDLSQWNVTGSWGIQYDTITKNHVLADSPNDLYSNNSNSIVSLKNKIKVFNAENCQLNFDYQTQMENCCDAFMAEIQINNNEWLEILHKNGINNRNNATFNLSEYLNPGDSLGLRFRFTSDGTNTFDGVLIDNINITGTGTENIHFNKNYGTIAPGTKDTVFIKFNANIIDESFFFTRFCIHTNDPLKKSDTVSCYFELNRFSTLVLSNDSLVFNPINVLLSDTSWLYLMNTGCDTLKIEKVFSDNPRFSGILNENILVAPNDSVRLKVTFNPVDSIVTSGNIYIVKNDMVNDTTYFRVKGQGNPYPVLELSATVIDTSLLCDETVHSKIKIHNNGSDTLEYSIPQDFYDGFDNNLENWEIVGPWATETIDGNTFISDSPDGFYQNNSDASICLKKPFRVFDKTNCWLSYRIKYEIEECCDLVETLIKVNNGAWISIDQETGTSAWITKQINLAEYISTSDSLNIMFRLKTDGAITKDGVSLDDIKLTGSGIGKILVDIPEAMLAPGATEELTLSFNATETGGENIKQQFRIESNDPFQRIDTFYCKYKINKYSTLTLLDSSLHFGNQNVFEKDTLKSGFVNLGCDTLHITQILAKIQAFSINPNYNRCIAPADTGYVEIIFEPVDSIIYNSQIGMVNSGIGSDTSYLDVSGRGNPYPYLVISDNRIDTLLNCSENINSTITLQNTGSLPLDYVISTIPNNLSEIKETNVADLVLSDSSGTIPPGVSRDLVVSFDANYTEDDFYKSAVHIFSNDPYKPDDSILCTYSIQKMSLLVPASDSLIFDATPVTVSNMRTMQLFNQGCDTLKILKVFSSSDEFIVDSAFNPTIVPGSFENLKINFTPTDSLIYNGKIGIINNTKNLDTTFIFVQGKGKPYPILSFSPKNIDTVQVCGNETRFNILLKNGGSAPLHYYFPIDFYDDFENGLINWDFTGGWGLTNSSYNGSVALTDSPDANYANNSDNYISLKNAITITDPDSCKLSYHIFNDMEACCDFLSTELSVNHGPWITLDEVNNTIDWRLKSFNLSGYVIKGDSLNIRFHFTSDIINTFDGVYIDDVAISGACSNQIKLDKTRGELQPETTDTLVFTNYIPFNTLPSPKGNLLVISNDPFIPVDTITYNIKNNCGGIGLFLGDGRSGAISFVLNNEVYIGLGENETAVFNDLWKFSTSTNNWTRISTFPGEARSNAVSFVLGGKVYIGLGFNKLTNHNFKDFYCFDPAINFWNQIADFNGKARSEAVSFVLNNKSYVGTGIQYSNGNDTVRFNDFFSYNAEQNRWNSLPTPSFAPRNGALTFEIYDKIYLAGGINSKSVALGDIYEFNPELNQWIEKNSQDSSTFSISNGSVIAEGNSAFLCYGNTASIFRYHPQSNKVTKLNDMPGISTKRLNPVAFIIDNEAYFGLGKYSTSKKGKQITTYPHELIKLPLAFDYSPTDILLNNQTVDENNSGNSPVGILSTVDKTPDDSFTYEVVADTQHFFVIENALWGKNLNYEKEKSHQVKIKTRDNQYNYYEKTFFIKLVDMPEAPYGISLSCDSLTTTNENNLFVGIFSALDEDTLDTHTFMFNYDNGVIDSKYYTLTGDSLVMKKHLSFNDTIHRFFVDAVDHTGLSYTAEINIKVIKGVGIIEFKPVNQDILIYPNPASNKLFVKSNKTGIKKITLMTITGEIIKEISGHNQKLISFEKGPIKPGIYLLRIDTGMEISLRKVILN